MNFKKFLFVFFHVEMWQCHISTFYLEKTVANCTFASVKLKMLGL